MNIQNIKLFNDRLINFNSISGGSVSKSKLSIYNPDNIKITDELEKKLIVAKLFLVFHLTGDYSKLKKVVGLIKTQLPKHKENITEGYYWYNMPEYISDTKQHYPIAYIAYFNGDDKKKLLNKLNINIQNNQRWVHYPNNIISNGAKYKYEITKIINPKYPVYIISKGRWKSRLTAKTLEIDNVPYKIVVEPQEYNEYSKVIDPSKILVLPNKYLNKDQGGIPARNFVWDHSVKSGTKKHWILDDNIDGFYRWNRSYRFKINSGVLFKLCEVYVSRFSNVVQSGMNYRMFYPSRSSKPPVHFNTRIYSCILIDHRLDGILKERWRGKYNEDTDLSLRILKSGYSTCLFNAFLCGKAATLSTAGGNTEGIYASGDKSALLAKAQALVDDHPDVASIVNRYKRGIHHEVNYNKFADNDPSYKNPKLYKRDKSGSFNDYNMKLVKL